MSQRESGYARKERDLYETPEWVTDALMPHIPRSGVVWEPAAGNGKMVNALRKNGMKVLSSDIVDGLDFLSDKAPCNGYFEGIITNPPYDSAYEFIARAIHLMAGTNGYVAMLLRTDFDHAASRHWLFADSPCFSKKVVLTKRIRWFEDSNGSPSFNHAWFIWDWQRRGPPTLAYEPRSLISGEGQP